MTKRELADEAQRWYSGAGRLSDLTPERLGVMWSTYGHLPAAVLRWAVDKALLEPRWPAADRFEALIAKAEDIETRRVAAERNEEARRASGGEGVAGLLSRQSGDTAFASACKHLALAVLSQHLTPSQAAKELEGLADEHMRIEDMDVRAWHDALVAAGDSWLLFRPRDAQVNRVRVSRSLFGEGG